jgi:hypothetical protein
MSISAQVKQIDRPPWHAVPILRPLTAGLGSRAPPNGLTVR